MEPDIRFCTTAGAARIAYMTLGQGPPLIFPPGWVSHLEMEWAIHSRQAFWQMLARHHTIVRYDRYGCGLSDHNRTECTLEADPQPLAAVADHLKLRQFELLGVPAGSWVAMAYAARFPRRVAHLILYAAYARVDSEERQLREAIAALVRAEWGLGSKTLADRFLPGVDAPPLRPLPGCSGKRPPQRWPPGSTCLPTTSMLLTSFPRSGCPPW